MQRLIIQQQPQVSARSGLTLLEVLVSTAIFLGALTAIIQLFSLGNEAEIMAKLDSEAVIRCESKMAEVLVGWEPTNSVSEQPFDDSANWQYSIDVVDTGTEGLLQITVTVSHFTANEEMNSTYSLVRLMRDPNLFLEAAISEESSE